VNRVNAARATRGDLAAIAPSRAFLDAGLEPAVIRPRPAIVA
jgi:hypothetical protein